VPAVHHFDPVAFSLGPLTVRWYGLMYLIGFALFLILGKLRSRDTWRGMSSQDVDDLLFYGMIGVIVGGRLGHVIFYGPLSHYLANPLEIFACGKAAWHRTAASSLIVAMWWFARSRRKSFLTVGRLRRAAGAAGTRRRRIGNYINGELWGRVADPALPWAMIFPQAGDNLPRHPSQLYQFALEGLLLFAILWLYSRKPRPAGTGAACS